MAENAKRVPLSEEERLYLLEQIKKYPIVQNKKTDVGTIAAKKRAWEEIMRIFNANGNFLNRSIVQLRKYWENAKARRKKGLGEQTRDLIGTGSGPYNPLQSAYPKVEMVATDLNYHVGYQWDGDPVVMEEAAAKGKISISEPDGSTFTGTSRLEYINTAEIPTSSSASLPLSATTPLSHISGNYPCNIKSPSTPAPQSQPSLSPPPTSPSFPPPPSLSPPPTFSSSPLSPRQTPHDTRTGVLPRTVCAHEARERMRLQEEKELHHERLAEVKLNRKEAEKRQQRSDELHRLEMERLHVKVEFETRQMEAEARHQNDMHREMLQAAKEKYEQESRHREEIHHAQLRKLLEPSVHSAIVYWKLVAAEKLFEFVFDIFCSDKLFARCDSKSRLIRRLSFTGELSGEYFEAYLIDGEVRDVNQCLTRSIPQADLTSTFPPQTKPSYVPKKRASGKHHARLTDATRRKQLKEAYKKYVKMLLEEAVLSLGDQGLLQYDLPQTTWFVRILRNRDDLRDTNYNITLTGM
uniref:Regulatory protein zeste n=1 Tax=Timema shepardi TaxID=629360 RepID=A0A7R9AYD6_TIMSH|nr:unnamed protein product [Timema shepardi]